MFLQVCVCPQGGSLVWGVSAPGVVPGPRGVCSQGVCSWGGLLPGGCLVWGVGIPACTEADPPPPGETATAADVTHPTGMHSCIYCFNFKNLMDVELALTLKIWWMLLAVTSILIQSIIIIHTFVVKLISLANTSNLFSLKVVQKCQHWQLCVLRENLNSLLRLHETTSLLLAYETEPSQMAKSVMHYFYLFSKIFSPIFIIVQVM